MPPVGPMPSVFLRPATEHDIGFLVDVVLVARLARGPLPDGVDVAARRAEEEQWTGRLLRGDAEHSLLSVIEIDGERAGRLRVVRAPEHIDLAGIHLLPPHQGHGIGTHLIEQLVVEARDSGLPLFLQVDPDNPRARSLYERLGFVPVGEADGEIRMQWQGSVELTG